MLIGHYMHGIWTEGGVATYIRRVTDAQRQRSHRVMLFDSLPSAKGVTRVSDGKALMAAARMAGLDLLHLHLDPPGGLPASVVPVVRTVHGHQPYCPSGTQYLQRRGSPCEREHGVLPCTWGHLVDRCGSTRPNRIVDNFHRTRNEHGRDGPDRFIAISRFVEKRLLRDGFPPQRIRHLANPAPDPDTDHDPPPPPPDVRYLYAGRLVPEKGLHVVLDALAIQSRGPQLDIAGTGPQEAALRSAVERRGLGCRVRFHGWCDPTRLASLVAESRALVVPSLWHEPFGLAALDAGVGGRAVIASRVGGLPEVVEDRVTGLVVAPGDVASLASAMDCLGHDRTLAANLGAAGLERARTTFSLDRHLAGLHGIYAEARSHPRPRR